MINEKIEAKLNIILGIVIAILSVVVIFLAAQLITGRDASLFGFRVYHIVTGSMEPTIKTGSTILVKSWDANKLKEGDIISFVSRDSAIYGNVNTHRIIEVSTDEAGNKCFVTQGDANRDADIVKVYPEDVKGKVVFHMNILGASAFLKFLRTVPGFITVILLPLLLVCWFFMKSFKREVDQMIRENNEIEALRNAEEKAEDKTEEKSDERSEEKSDENSEEKTEEKIGE